MNTPFICPICGQTLTHAGTSLVCPARHTFDVARQGYVNLLLKKPDTLYEDKALFIARRAVYEAGFFDPVVMALADAAEDGSMLDAGCGEGSLLRRMAAPGRQRIGLDIAKAAVQMAASADKDASWCVGDVCNLPLADGSIQTLLNVLTPANYAEFSRVLAPNGILLKVIPGAEHLQEIRAMTGKSAYAHSLDDALAAFTAAFALTRQERITYTFACDAPMARSIFTMTPMTAHDTLATDVPASITVDVTLLAGRKR